MALMDVLVKVEGPMNMWPFYDAINVPTLVLRGESSDLFPVPVFEAMTERGPKAEAVTIPGCGHAPFLDTPEQIALVRNFLARNS